MRRPRPMPSRHFWHGTCFLVGQGNTSLVAHGKEVPLKKSALLPLWMVMVLGLAACNTMRGAGEDVEAAGEGVQDAAEDTEEDLENRPM